VRSGAGAPPGVTGFIRVDRRTKNLTKRLRPGEIAIIDHSDLDRVSAEALVACKPAAVINASPSISGRYPNQGPQILLAAGIPLIDDAGGDLLDLVVEGELLRLHAGTLYGTNPPWPPAMWPTPKRSRRPCWPPAPGCPPSSRRSWRTPWSTWSASTTCCSTRSRCPPCAPVGTAGTP